jgi:hypothetical protein
LVEIIGDGSAYLWLVEKPGVTSIDPLINDIDFNQPHENAFLYDDLTGDTTPELIIYRQFTPSDTSLVPPHIFDLAIAPPVELPIQDQSPMDFGLEPHSKFEVMPDTQGVDKIQVTYTLLPSCPVYVSQNYAWNESSFVTTPLQYELVPIFDYRAYCEVALDEASLGWGPEAAINIGNAMLEIWPPETDTQGQPYPAYAYDQLRYRLGVLYALAGQPSETTRILSEIINMPIVPDSI